MSWPGWPWPAEDDHGREMQRDEAREKHHELHPDEAYDDGFDLECTHCGGEGTCYDGSDPLGDCPDEEHPCHACYGSGKRRDQTIF